MLGREAHPTPITISVRIQRLPTRVLARRHLRQRPIVGADARPAGGGKGAGEGAGADASTGASKNPIPRLCWCGHQCRHQGCGGRRRHVHADARTAPVHGCAWMSRNIDGHPQGYPFTSLHPGISMDIHQGLGGAVAQGPHRPIANNRWLY
jgi:hypothetical protein